MRLASPVSCIALIMCIACDGTTRGTSSTGITAPTASLEKHVPTSTTRTLLERAARDLTYTSESDYPFVWFFQLVARTQGDAPAAELDEVRFIPDSSAHAFSVEDFRALLEVPPTEQVDVVSLDAFFARHIENVDPADSVAVALVPRYLVLRETLRRTLRGVQVFRVGQIVIRCYLVGIDGDGNLAGLTTTAIET